MFSRESISEILLVLISLMALINSATKIFSFSLSLIILYFLVWICSLKIGIVTISRAWSETRYYLEWMEWLSSSSDPNLRNIRSRTEFESWLLLEYLVGMQLVGLKRAKYIKSVMSKSKFLWMKWCGWLKFYKLSLMLKLPVMIRTLLILTSVSLRYFKANWDKFE